MEFWGVEVKSGESFVVKQENDVILHLSQACLGEVKKDKGSEPVRLFAKVDDEKFVIGILSSEKFPQISFDLVFEKEFELSHNWKNGSVYFTGYTSVIPKEYSDHDSEDEDNIEPIPIENDRSSLQAKPEAKNEDVSKDVKFDQKVKVKSEEEESSDDDFGSEDEDDSDDEETDESEDEDEENKVDVGQKRPAEAAKKTSGGDKKAKFQTPEKAVAETVGNKVGGHTATPYPAKQAGKTAAKNEQQPKQQTPKSGGAFPCKSCNRSFGSENALQSHTKAKHATAK